MRKMKMAVKLILLLLSLVPAAALAAEEAVPAEQEITPPVSSQLGWFPDEKLFAAFLADPRRVAITGGIRYGDDSYGKYRVSYLPYSNVLWESHITGKSGLYGTATLGGRMPIYRWALPAGELQVGLEGCAWTVFAFIERRRIYHNEGSTQLNTDYQMGLPFEYAYGDFSLFYRFYHQSSHLGDEFVLRFPMVHRINLSNEALECFLSYNFFNKIRLYGGGGYVVHHFQDYRLKPVYLKYGLELRPFTRTSLSRTLGFQPYVAAHYDQWQNNNWSVDQSYALGLEFTSVRNPNSRKVRLYLEYHRGHSVEGQFFKEKTDYVSVNLSYEF